MLPRITGAQDRETATWRLGPMRWPRRPKKTAEDAFQARWDDWWDSAGRRDVMRLLARYGLPTDPYFDSPY